MIKTESAFVVSRLPLSFFLSVRSFVLSDRCGGPVPPMHLWKMESWRAEEAEGACPVMDSCSLVRLVGSIEVPPMKK